jgi:hypothetical protein
MSPEQEGDDALDLYDQFYAEAKRAGSVQGVKGGRSSMDPLSWSVYVLGPARHVWEMAC